MAYRSDLLQFDMRLEVKLLGRGTIVSAHPYQYGTCNYNGCSLEAGKLPQTTKMEGALGITLPLCGAPRLQLSLRR